MRGVLGHTEDMGLIAVQAKQHEYDKRDYFEDTDKLRYSKEGWRTCLNQAV
jgi:hypothetical protein